MTFLTPCKGGDNLAWVSLPEMDAHAADQRKLRETEEKRIRQVEDEKQERIRIREGIAKADADMQMKERMHQMDEEAKRLGMIKLLCAACKIETRFGSPESDWAACPECKRFTNFWPLKQSN